jgi:hypothetical protein
MKKVLVLMSLAALALLAGCAATSREARFTRHYSDSLFKATEKGHYSIEMVVLGGKLMAGTNSLDLIIHDRDDAGVLGADIRVIPWMPDMGHGVRERPSVVEKGGGLYSVENIDIMMPGRWQLTVEVKKDGLSDGAVFDFPGVKRDEGERMKPARNEEAPNYLDVSTTRASTAGLFSVTFKSRSETVPVNAIHSWLLTVRTAEGEPVTDAVIKVSGNMPEHGHGMPTRPTVTENLGGGVYLVEGMKFQMSGWWVVSLRIRSGEKDDTVAFNLRVK